MYDIVLWQQKFINKTWHAVEFAYSVTSIELQRHNLLGSYLLCILLYFVNILAFL